MSSHPVGATVASPVNGGGRFALLLPLLLLAWVWLEARTPARLGDEDAVCAEAHSLDVASRLVVRRQEFKTRLVADLAEGHVPLYEAIGTLRAWLAVEDRDYPPGAPGEFGAGRRFLRTVPGRSME